MNKDFFRNKKVLIMGLGRFGGGVDAVKFVHKAGSIVTVTDLAPAEKLKDSIDELKDLSGIEYHLGGHQETDFEHADIVIANPAVPPDNKFLDIARSKNKFIASQVGIFFELCPAVKIGITGANGKSTTTALTAHLLKNAGEIKNSKLKIKKLGNVHLSGNIGDEPLLDILDQIRPDDLVVLELSSFQIEQLALVKKMPDVALLTNLTPNHLDRYGTFDKYCDAKELMFRHQKLDAKRPAVSIFNAADEVGCGWFEKYKGDKGRLCLKFSPDDIGKKIRAAYELPGGVYLSNLAAAVAIVRRFGISDEEIINALPSFKGLPHRLELVADKDGVRWYNDSKATTPASSIAALDAFDCPRIIIAGGYDKHIPFDEFGEKIARCAKAAILMGQTAGKIAEAIKKTSATEDTESTEKKIKIVKSLSEAVETARKLAVKGDVVLLSTACASYDMFENYEQRGNQFRELVRKA